MLNKVILCAQIAPVFHWAKGHGGIDYDDFKGVCMDAVGNVYITGTYTGTIDFDPGPGVYTLSTIYRNVFITKLDVSGNLAWVKEFSSLAPTNLNSEEIILGTSGSLFVTGSMTGTLDVDPGPSTYSLSGQGMFVCKLDNTGNFVWGKAMVGGSVNPYDLTLDISSNLYITGYHTGSSSIDFDPGPAVYNPGGNSGSANIFICKLDNNGDHVWTRAYTSGGSSSKGKSTKVDSAGNVFTTGIFQFSTDFDPGVSNYYINAGGAFDVFITKLNSTGNFCWAKRIGGIDFSSFADGTELEISSGPIELIISGQFSKIVDFDPGPGTYTLNSANPGADGFIAKYDTSGNFTWVKSYNNAGVTSMVLDNGGNINVVGKFSASTDLDPGAASYFLPVSGTSDLFISKLDNDANFIWAGSVGTNTQEVIYKLCSNGNVNELTAIGSFADTGDFDPTTGTYSLATNGHWDGFVFKLRGNITSVLTSEQQNEIITTFPNPCYDKIYMRGVQDHLIYVYDVTGRKVYSELSQYNELQIDFSRFTKGLYLLHSISPNKIVRVQKLIKD